VTKTLATGTCKLCHEERDLQQSDYMPAALYPKGLKLQYVTPAKSGIIAQRMKARVLCVDCERRFNRNGESEVLRHIAPKSLKRFPLHEKLRVALPRQVDSTTSRYSGDDLGIDMDKFAYFTLSVVWRAAVHEWVAPDGRTPPRFELGNFAEPIRMYLLGKGPFPSDTAVIVVVGTDQESRNTWYTPTCFVEANCLNFRFLARGVFFRAMMGRHLSDYFRDTSCTSPRRCIFSANLKVRIQEMFEDLESAQKLNAECRNLSSFGPNGLR
jgi:hypothetical protein